jgi:flagellar secretion chaperone FliS
MTVDASSAYRHSDGRSAGPVRLVIMLYEQLVKDLQRTIAAMEKKDVVRRTNELDHALRVVGQLQGTLDMDQGGEVASHLRNYYNSLRASLLQAQIRISPDILQKQIQILLGLREAWVEVERSHQAATEPPAAAAPIVQSSMEKSLRWSI